MIPKILHYVWVSKEQKLPDLVQKCLDSWHTYLPGWEIKVWNQSNLDIENIPWLRSCYSKGQWAYGFIVDYLKAWCLYTYGGVYVDSDYILNKPIDDELLNNPAFIGFNSKDSDIISGAIIGSEKGNPIFNYIQNFYKDKEFDVTCYDRPFWNSIYIYTQLIKEQGVVLRPLPKNIPVRE